MKLPDVDLSLLMLVSCGILDQASKRLQVNGLLKPAAIA